MNQNPGSLQDEANNFLKALPRKKKIHALGKLSLPAAVWKIWRERNRRIFQYQKATKVDVFKKVQDDIYVLMMKCNWQVSDDPVEFQVLSNWVL